ncbi:MAG TPA: PaaX family transcriptional regulator C-terminal domain-containing protein [Acidimicrobiia bacterium]|nr:PaaX family transcriptional regulator C-terminal domain-containing protein [Acidimicrobiia bacterium]
MTGLSNIPAQRPLTPRSLIASLLLGMQPPRLPGALLVRWCGAFGVAEGTARVAMSRMVERGELAAADGVYELAGRVRARQAPQDWSVDPELERWDGAWRLATVTSAARAAADRAALRDTFRQLRYAEYREGVWCRPHNVPRVGAPESAWAVAEAQCAFWTGRPDEEAHALAARLFDPIGWAGQARDLTARLDATTKTLRAPSDDDLAAAFTTGAAALAHIRHDALLPPPLCPKPWPGTELRASYRRYQRTFAAAARTWFRAA